MWPNEKGSQVPVTAFWSSSVSNAIGPACGIVALKYISYPVQVFCELISGSHVCLMWCYAMCVQMLEQSMDITFQNRY